MEFTLSQLYSTGEWLAGLAVSSSSLSILLRCLAKRRLSKRILQHELKKQVD